ncbi:MAG: EamA family transporter [Gammaproteobacteria bacterium WSBS_2016_MAG_OTU1]
MSTVLGFAVWGRLLTLYSAATVTPFAFLVPIAGIFSGWLFLDERISGGELGGAILIMLGLACSIFGARKIKI